MKKPILFLLLCLFCSISATYGQNVEVTLNDGTVVKGNTNTLFMMDDADMLVVKDIVSGEKNSYKSTDIKSLKHYDSDSKDWIKYVPLMALKSMPNIWRKNPKKTYKTPVFMATLYEGKNVSAYMHFISTVTNTKTLPVYGRNCVYYFKLKNENVAKAYWMGSSIGAKAFLKLVFKPYPVMKETISKLDTKEFYNDPVSIIKVFDGLLK